MTEKCAKEGCNKDAVECWNVCKEHGYGAPKEEKPRKPIAECITALFRIRKNLRAKKPLDKKLTDALEASVGAGIVGLFLCGVWLSLPFLGVLL